MPSLKRVIGPAITLVLCSVISFARQSPTVEWEHAEDVGPSDRQAILRLASRLGIPQPRVVSFAGYLPIFCRFVRVESEVTMKGHRRSWQELRLRRQDWRECIRVPRSSRLREGRWIGSRAELSTEESWRIVDGDWFVDVRLGATVRYEDAERIVLAVRHTAIVNRLPLNIGPLKLDATMPVIDADEIVSIEPVSAVPGAFEVRTGRGATGEVYELRIQNGAVELHHWGTWTVRFEGPPNRRLQPSAADRIMTRRG